MDRGKSGVKRPQKKAAHPGHAPPGEFFALGTKDSKSGAAVAPSSSSLPRKTSSSSVGGSKPSASIGPSQPAPKKVKLGPQLFTPLGRHGDTERRSSPTTQQHLYDEMAEEVDPSELLDHVNDAAEREDEERVEALLCGAVKYLKANRSRPEASMTHSLMYLSKYRPSIFNSDVVIDAFCSLLKREVSLSFKSKGNPVVSILTCNVLLESFMEEENWPEQFIKVYMDDAMGERIWVDRDDCKAFVLNIQKAFNTKMPKFSAMVTEAASKDGTSSPVITKPDDEDDSLSGLDSALSKDSATHDDDINSLVAARYTYQPVSIESYVLDILREQLGRRQSMDGGSRNLLRVMTATCGYSEVRTMASTRLEMWLQNPKLTRPAQDLLMSVCLNCDQHSHIDIEVMSQLSKIRLKTKPLISHYLLSVRELLNQHPENLRTLMAHTVYNELSNSRNPNNMALLGVMFSFSPQPSAKILSEIFQDLLANREDYLRSLRILLREIVRTVRQDMNFAEFAVGLMKERSESKFKDMDTSLKERLFVALSDLITLTALLSVSPAVKEAATSGLGRADDKDVDVLKSFQQQMSVIQRDAVSWLHAVVPKMFDVKQNDYVHCLRKILFMEASEHYVKIDNWPPESDRSLVLRLVSEVPVLEDTLLRVLIMGIAREIPVNATDAIDLVDQLVKRAAGLYTEDFPVLVVERVDLIDLLLNLCTYRHPENISLPKGYKPPSLAITNLYWKAWVIMLIISAFNPNKIGLVAWSNYPMLKCLMEMVMTRNFKFPPPTMVGVGSEEKSLEEIKLQQTQLNELEKQQIVEFEGHLAAATSRKQITDANSLLLSQLTTMDPSGPSRQPPKTLCDQLEALNQKLGIGHLLCRSRNPDFLLEIIHRQGTSQSMPWLAELVEANDSSLDVLPVQCLCEFLLHDSTNPAAEEDAEKETNQSESNKGKRGKQKMRKQEQLLGRLQTLLHSQSSDSRTIREVLGYFLKRLSSQGHTNRALAVKGLSMVLSQSHLEPPPSPMDMDENPAVVAIPTHKWLLAQLPSLPQFSEVKQSTCSALRQACQVETDAAAVSAYIVFLSQHTSDLQLQELDELSLDLAQLIVERATLMNHLLPQEGATVHQKRADFVLTSMMDLFYDYLLKAQLPDREAYSWSNTQDQILLQWESGKSATINVLVVHAMIILLTYGQPKGPSCYDDLLESWFPSEGHPPSAYLVDTSEEALLLPDWLKLRMIRSRTERLVDAALMDLEPSQLLLFVQSFGIPVASMSKLLKCLDRAVALDSCAMEQVVVDKNYMAQLVQVQHMRGAQGGVKFHQMLSPDDLPELSTMPDEDIDMATPDSPGSSQDPKVLRPQTQSLVHADASQQSVVAALYTVFGVSSDSDRSVSRREQQTTFRALQKSLSDPESCQKVVAGLVQILSSPNSSQFTIGMKKSSHVSCALLRLLSAKQLPPTADLSSLLTKLSEALRGSNNTPLARVVATCLVKGRDKTQATGSIRPQSDLQEHVEEGFKATVERNDPKADIYINSQMVRAIRGQKVTQRSEVMCQMLHDFSQRRVPLMPAQGLLVDWLHLVNPELCTPPGEHPSPLQDLLFSSLVSRGHPDRSHQAPGGSTSLPPPGGSTSQPPPGGSTCQPYLLAHLTQHSSWPTLHRYLRRLLSSEPVSSLDARTVLDFVNACVLSPKVWQGRDKKIPKHSLTEEVLCPTAAQTRRLVDYILVESVCRGDASNIQKRANLLLSCCAEKSDLLATAVNHLENVLTQTRTDKVYAVHLLTEVYLRHPNLVNVTNLIQASLDNRTVFQAGVSQLDSLAHRVVCTLGNAAPGKAVENSMYDANIALRKLAAQQPIIVLRQLPVMSALLQSRAQFTFNELKHRNHLLLYTHVLGVLELLQPHVFQPQYTTSLEAVISSFFELLKIHRRIRHLGPVVTKFIKFLNNFMICASKDAWRVLHAYTYTLSELTSMYQDLSVLRSLIAALSLPGQNPEGSSDSDGDHAESQGWCAVVPPRPTSPWNMTQLAPYIQRIAKGSPQEDVLTVLADLDETSKRKVDILQHFMADLQRLMSDRDDQCRNTAHSLIMRYIRHEPCSAPQVVPAYLQCVSSDNMDVVTSALRNLPEFSLLAQEHGKQLLGKVFTTGVVSKVDVLSFVSEAVQLLNMETLL